MDEEMEIARLRAALSAERDENAAIKAKLSSGYKLTKFTTKVRADFHVEDEQAPSRSLTDPPRLP